MSLKTWKKGTNHPTETACRLISLLENKTFTTLAFVHKTMINTTLCYIEKADSYLMIHRTKKAGDVNKDKWIGIGGKFELGESPWDCVRREVREETGIILREPEYRGIVTFVSRETAKPGKPAPETYYELMHLFWCGDFEEPTSLVACDEGDLEWVPKSEMNKLPHWQGDEIFLDLLDKNVPFFSLKLEYKNGRLVNTVLE